MVEHDWHRRRHHQIFQCLDYNQSRVNLDVPLAGLNSLNGCLEKLARSSRIRLEGSLKIQSNTANAGAIHSVEHRLAGLVINHGYSTRAWTNLSDGVQQTGIVSTLDAGLDDHYSLDVQRPMQVAHLFDRCRLGRVGPRREKRKALGVSEN